MRSKREWRGTRRHELARVECTLKTQKERLEESEQSFATARKNGMRGPRDRPLTSTCSGSWRRTWRSPQNTFDTRKKDVSATRALARAAAERLIETQQILDGVERAQKQGVKEHARGETAKQYAGIRRGLDPARGTAR